MTYTIEQQLFGHFVSTEKQQRQVKGQLRLCHNGALISANIFTWNLHGFRPVKSLYKLPRLSS